MGRIVTTLITAAKETTIDPYSFKVQNKFYKNPKLGKNRPNSKQDAEMYGHPNTV